MQKGKHIYFLGLDEPGVFDLAVAASRAGDKVHGSAEGVTEETKAKLLKFNILLGNLQEGTTAVVHGSKVQSGHADYLRSKELGIPAYSVSEYVREYSSQKQRVVIAGTTGRNIITLLLIHALTFHKRKFDYVSSTIPYGKDATIALSDAPTIIIEGLDTADSHTDSTPAFLKYQHHIGIISDIRPGDPAYARQFGLFETSLPKSGILIYNEKDPVITGLLTLNQTDVLYVPYAAHPSTREGGQDFLLTDKETYPVRAPGPNALLNMNAAKDTLKKIGITSGMFYQSIRSFQVSGR